MRPFASIVVIAVMALVPVAAFAQGELPDVVVLRSGAMVRGTIIEVVPGARVVIVAADGSTRTFAGAEVEYAGSADDAPRRAWIGSDGGEDESDTQASAAPGDDESDEETLDDGEDAGEDDEEAGFDGDESALILRARPSRTIVAEPVLGGGIVELCRTPCEASLAPGTYRFGVVFDERRPLRSGSTFDDVPVLVRDGTVLAIRSSERDALRAVGGIVTALMVIATGAGIVASIFVPDDRWPAIGATIGAASVLFGVGVPLAALERSVRVELGER